MSGTIVPLGIIALFAVIGIYIVFIYLHFFGGKDE